MSKTDVMAVLEQFAAHMVTMTDAADRIDALYRPASEPDTTTAPMGYIHWVDCSSAGVVNVYHVSDCEGGENCQLFQYLSAPGGMEKHIKRGNEYEVTKNDAGEFVFENTGKTSNKTKLPKKGTQASLL